MRGQCLCKIVQKPFSFSGVPVISSLNFACSSGVAELCEAGRGLWYENQPPEIPAQRAYLAVDAKRLQHPPPYRGNLPRPDAESAVLRRAVQPFYDALVHLRRKTPCDPPALRRTRCPDLRCAGAPASPVRSGSMRLHTWQRPGRSRHSYYVRRRPACTCRASRPCVRLQAVRCLRAA